MKMTPTDDERKIAQTAVSGLHPLDATMLLMQLIRDSDDYCTVAYITREAEAYRA